MSNRLAFKHKNSLALNEHKMISRETEGSKMFHLCLKPFGISSFLIIMCCIFIGFWFIMCPLIWSLCYSSSVPHNWPKFWPILFWMVALIIWIWIVTLFIYIWKCVKNKHHTNIKRRSYGSDGENNHTHLLGENIQSAVAMDKSNDKTIIDIDSSSKDVKDCDKKNVNDSKVIGDGTRKHSKRKNDLPPLIIHRRSRNNIDNISGDTTEKNDDNELKMDDIQETNVDKNSIKDYLKLVTVTPSEEDKNIVSPKTPMSPRDLFFIDMIKEAEKAEKNKENNQEDLSKRHSKFFMENTIPSMIDSVDSKPNNSDDKDIKKDDEDDKDDENDKENDKKKVGRESKYFIAEVESSKSEKTEVFIEINKTLESDSGKESLDLCTVKMNENNSAPVLEIKSPEEDGLKENRNM